MRPQDDTLFGRELAHEAIELPPRRGAATRYCCGYATSRGSRKKTMSSTPNKERKTEQDAVFYISEGFERKFGGLGGVAAIGACLKVWLFVGGCCLLLLHLDLYTILHLDLFIVKSTPNRYNLIFTSEGPCL